MSISGVIISTAIVGGTVIRAAMEHPGQPWIARERLRSRRPPWGFYPGRPKQELGQERKNNMIEKFVSMKKELSELASVLNAFKSEAVQLRILELLLGSKSKEEIAGQEEGGKPTRRVRARRAPKTKGADGGAPGKRKKEPAGSGANATLTQLLSGNFFDKPRTINNIIEHCKHKLAHTFKANEFSGKLGRMVRDDELTREKNADKQYEYKKP